MYRYLLPIFFLLFACSTNPNHPQKPQVNSGPNTPTRESASSSLPPLPNEGPLQVRIHNEVLLRDVDRFGINISQFENWGTGQIVKNLVRRNPGFEPWGYRSIVEVAEGGKQRFLDVPPPGAWAEDFWKGAQFEVIFGAAKGRSGEISAFQRGPKGCTYEVTGDGAAFSAGDQVVLRQRRTQPATEGWWPKIQGTASISAERADLAPDSGGEQALRLEAPAPQDVAGLHNYFDSPKGDKGPMLPLRGTFTLSFQAKGLSPAAKLNVSLLRHVQPNRLYLKETLALTPSWKSYQLSFDAADDEQPALVDLSLKITAGTCLLDNVSLSRNGDLNPTVFREEVVNALQEMRPGILRYWAGQLGDSLANQLVAGAYQGPSGYSRWGKNPKIIGFSLPEFLSLCELLEADLWYVVPLTFTRQERLDLIEYLAGSINTPMGALRAKAGHPKPWSKTLGRIFLEMGNESWNGTFKGGIVERPEVYGQVCTDFFAEFRSSGDYDADCFRLVLGGQAVWAGRNKTIAKNNTGADTLALAPYLLHKLDEPLQVQEPLARLFAEVAELGQQGYLKENRSLLADLPLSVYEVNLHTTNGSASEAVLMDLLPSAGAGVAVAAHMLSMLADHGIRDQCLYNLNQFGFLRGDKKNVRLWGALREVCEDGRKRPTFLALQLMNKALGGDMLQVEIGGTATAFVLGDVRINKPLRVYAFREGKQMSLLAVNLNPSNECQFKLLAHPLGPVQKTYLAFENPRQHNEWENLVSLKQETLSTWPEDSTLTLPAAGLCLWQWQTLAK